MTLAERCNVKVSGPADAQPMVFAHGFGCDQNMWRHVAPRFEDRFRVVLFDHVGAGRSDRSAYDAQRYDSLHGYADDVLGICRELDLRDVVFVGHSVSCMIGALAARAEPERFAKLVFVSPSPRYIDDPIADDPIADGHGADGHGADVDGARPGGSGSEGHSSEGHGSEGNGSGARSSYVGGFSEADIHELLDSLDSNYLGWSSAMAPVIMGNEERPELGRELTESFCRTDPEIARRFARVTFLSDNRADLPHVATPTLVLQCTNDAIAPLAVGEYVRDALPDGTLVLLTATGHCPNLSAPDETAAAIAAFVDR